MNFEKGSETSTAQSRENLNDILPSLQAVGDFIDSTFESRGGASMYRFGGYSNRQVKEQFKRMGLSKNMEAAGNKFGATLASHCSNPETDPKEFIANMDTRSPKLFLDNFAVNNIVELIQPLIEEKREFKSILEVADGDIRSKMNDPEFAYSVTSAFCAPTLGRFLGDKEMSDGDSLKVVIAQSGYQENEVNIGLTLVAKLRNGTFDKMIAREVLTAGIGSLGAEKNDDILPRPEFVKMLRLAQLMDDRPTPDLLELLTSSTYIDYWPDACMKVLDDRKNEMIQRVSSNLVVCRKALEDNELLLADEGPEALEKAYDEYYTLAVAHRASMAKRHGAASKRIKKAGKPIRPQARMVEVATIPEPRKLTIVDEKGEISEGEPGYEKTILEYLEGHLGEKDLEKDLHIILDYLRKLDFSKGIVRGVKKYLHSMDNNGQKENLYALKPKEATGLSTSSAIAKKIRVLFVQNPERIGIVAITDRDNLVKFEKGMGRTTGASK